MTRSVNIPAHVDSWVVCPMTISWKPSISHANIQRSSMHRNIHEHLEYVKVATITPEAKKL